VVRKFLYGTAPVRERSIFAATEYLTSS